MTDLAELLEQVLRVGQALIDLSAGSGRAVQIVVQPDASSPPTWLPYIQGLGAIASAVAVGVAIFVPTRIQRRTLAHDRKIRRDEDVIREMAASLTDVAEAASVINSARWLPATTIETAERYRDSIRDTTWQALRTVERSLFSSLATRQLGSA